MQLSDCTSQLRGLPEPSPLKPPTDWRGTTYAVGQHAIYASTGSARQCVVEIVITAVDYNQLHRWKWSVRGTIVNQSVKPLPTGLKAQVSTSNLNCLTIIEGATNGEHGHQAAQGQGSVAGES